MFTCHTASIGTSAAYRLFRVGDGGFEKVGCTKRDFQNYHRYLKCAINTSDAQMFIDNLAKRKEANPAFFFDYMLDEQGRLVHIFWADTTSRKNYAHFGDVISFDSTYTTNQYLCPSSAVAFLPTLKYTHHLMFALLGNARELKDTWTRVEKKQGRWEQGEEKDNTDVFFMPPVGYP